MASKRGNCTLYRSRFEQHRSELPYSRVDNEEIMRFYVLK